VACPCSTTISRWSVTAEPRLGSDCGALAFTGLFDFFVHAFGTPWLNWWEGPGRPKTEAGLAFKAQEAEYLARWKQVGEQAGVGYCDRQRPASPQIVAPPCNRPAQGA